MHIYYSDTYKYLDFHEISKVREPIWLPAGLDKGMGSKPARRPQIADLCVAIVRSNRPGVSDLRAQSARERLITDEHN